MTQPVATAPRPAAPAKNTLPAGVEVGRYWRETPDGPVVRHDHERPVDEATEMPVGTWWMCPADPACKIGEWVFPRADGAPARPKKRGCPDHVCELLPGRSEPTDDDPKRAARGRLQQAIATKRAAARKAATDATQARINALRAAGREEALRMQSNMREHVPSAAVSLAALVTDWALIENLGGLETYALGTGLAVGGAVLAYLAVYSGELVYARRMGYTLRELPASVRARARSHARWIAAGVLSTGAWLVIGETIGARLDNWQGVVANLIAAVMIGVVNYNPWAAMVQRRKDEARANQDAAEAAARVEENRLAAIQAEQGRRRKAAEDAKRAAEEAALNEAKKIVQAEDSAIVAGRKFAARWVELAEAAKADRGMGPGFEIWRTEVVVGETRKLTTKAGGDEIVIGHEFLIRADPGVLPPRVGSAVSPFVAMKPWLVSMLELRSGMVDLTYQPQRLSDDDAEPEALINHGLVTLYDSHPLAENIDHPGPAGVHIDERGVRWGFAGRGLRGQAIYRRHWIPGQAGGGIRVGVTGMGKSVVTQVTALNDLLLGILPIIHDAGKNAMDFVDFYGIIPVGHTIEHREIIRESLWAEMKRRQAWINSRTVIGLNGMEVVDDPTWDPEAGGPPIRAIWEEFHMHARDSKFTTYFGSQVRLQRATAIFAEGATQGSGLADWADQNSKEQMSEILLQMMRVSDHTARVSGYNGGLMPSSLPALAGMMVMQEFKGEPVAYRSAFIPREKLNPKSLAYRLREPDGTPGGKQIVFAPELPPETIEVFKRHGLWDLWEMGKTKSGRAQLQSEADPVGSTVYPPAVSAALTQTAPVVKPKLRADDVVVAMLKHHLDAGEPFLTQTDMLGSPWWRQVDGEWSKTEAGVPSASTISRAVTKGLSAGEHPLIVKDDSEKQARWSLLPAGIHRADQMLTILASAGVLGPQAQARVRGQAQTDGVDIAEMERRVMLEAEQESLMRELLREAAAGLQQPGAS